VSNDKYITKREYQSFARALDHSREREKGYAPAMRMLREARDAITMIHAIVSAVIEVSSVPSSWGLHLGIPSRVYITMVDCEEERILRSKQEARRRRAKQDETESFKVFEKRR
jgi:hypothetical protein